MKRKKFGTPQKCYSFAVKLALIVTPRKLLVQRPYRPYATSMLEPIHGTKN